MEEIILLHQRGEESFHIAELGDEAAREGERVFWDVLGVLGLDGRDYEGEDTELVTVMWPSLGNENEE
jgi:hypothetical protein